MKFLPPYEEIKGFVSFAAAKGETQRTARVQQFPHSTLELHRAVAFADNIILMKYMTEKVSVIELMGDRTRDFIWQRFEPVRVVPSQRHVEGDDILRIAGISSETPIFWSMRRSGNARPRTDKSAGRTVCQGLLCADQVGATAI